MSQRCWGLSYYKILFLVLFVCLLFFLFFTVFSCIFAIVMIRLFSHSLYVLNFHVLPQFLIFSLLVLCYSFCILWSICFICSSYFLVSMCPCLVIASHFLFQFGSYLSPKSCYQLYFCPLVLLSGIDSAVPFYPFVSTFSDYPDVYKQSCLCFPLSHCLSLYVISLECSLLVFFFFNYYFYWLPSSDFW